MKLLKDYLHSGLNIKQFAYAVLLNGEPLNRILNDLAKEFESADAWAETLEDDKTIDGVKRLKQYFHRVEKDFYTTGWSDIVEAINEKFGFAIAKDFRQKHFYLLLNDSHGVYLPQIANHILDWQDGDLVKGPDGENYWEAWEERLNTERGLYQDGDLWCFDADALDDAIDLMGDHFYEVVMPN